MAFWTTKIIAWDEKNSFEQVAAVPWGFSTAQAAVPWVKKIYHRKKHNVRDWWALPYKNENGRIISVMENTLPTPTWPFGFQNLPGVIQGG